MLDVQLPPAIYDVPYTGTLVEIELPLAHVTMICVDLGASISRAGNIIYGCSWARPASCFVIVPKIGPGIELADQYKIHRHEIGHCNGWPADHSVPKVKP